MFPVAPSKSTGILRESVSHGYRDKNAIAIRVQEWYSATLGTGTCRRMINLWRKPAAVYASELVLRGRKRRFKSCVCEEV